VVLSLLACVWVTVAAEQAAANIKLGMQRFAAGAGEI